MTVYIAGPMQGIPGFNFPAFHQAAALLRAKGYRVVNPAELDLACGFAVGDPVDKELIVRFLLRDLAELAHCDAIALLDGWENSKGAAVELTFAAALNIPSKFVEAF